MPGTPSGRTSISISKPSAKGNALLARWMLTCVTSSRSTFIPLRRPSTRNRGCTPTPLQATGQPSVPFSTQPTVTTFEHPCQAGKLRKPKEQEKNRQDGQPIIYYNAKKQRAGNLSRGCRHGIHPLLISMRFLHSPLSSTKNIIRHLSDNLQYTAFHSFHIQV